VLHPQHLGQQHGGVDDEYGDRANPKVEEEEEEDDDDDDDDENHHFYHGNNLHSHHPPDVQVSPALYDEIAVARRAIPDNARDFRAQSPATANLPLQTVAARSTSPVPFRDGPLSRPHSHQTISMPPPAKPENKPTVITSATTTAAKTNVFDKTSSYTDSSAERSPLAPNDAREEKKRNRPISDLLDYDPQTLQNLSFPDLDNQSFDIDPRRPPDNNTTSASTTPTSSDPHLQRLHTLKSLSSSDRDKFFSSQTKDQWVASTEFFEKRLTELFDELRIARERRRDVARRFEAEIRGRMGSVERSGEGIEKCLGEIRGKAKGVLPARDATPVR
jgi:Extracellular mutant protein 11